jgi:hypothetical protein
MCGRLPKAEYAGPSGYPAEPLVSYQISTTPSVEFSCTDSQLLGALPREERNR